MDFFEQARVFNRDHGLVRKGIDEFDLAFGEWADLSAPDEDHANCLTCVDQRDGERGAKAELEGIRLNHRQAVNRGTQRPLRRPSLCEYHFLNCRSSDIAHGVPQTSARSAAIVFTPYMDRWIGGSRAFARQPSAD